MKLENIFKKQRELMNSLAPVEQSLGYTPPPIPLDFTQRGHQDWFRLMSWYLVEELVEANMAEAHLFPEEMADALHFAVELCILAGVKAEDVEYILEIAAKFDSVPEIYTVMDVINSLGGAVNRLKAKHWKKNPTPPDMEVVKVILSNTLFRLIRVMVQEGIDYEAEYFKKHQENNNRIKSGY